MRNPTIVACVMAAAASAANADPVLDALIQEALERNPKVLEAEAHRLAAQYDVRQATALPDPSVTVTRHIAPVQTRVGPQFHGVAIRQAVPWFGKRADRGKVAGLEAEALGHDVDTASAETVRQVKHGYYELGYLDRAIDITAQESELLRHYEGLARARYSQGVGLQQAVVKLQARITRVLSRLRGFEARRANIESTLNALRDRPVDARLAKVRLGDRPGLAIDDEELATLARGHRPELQAASARLEGAEGAVRLSRRAYWPDVAFGAAWGDVAARRDAHGVAQPPPDNGDDVLSVSIGITVPIYRSRLDSRTKAAMARVQAAERAQREIERRIEQEVRAALTDLAAIDDQIALFERALLPQAEQALGTTEEAYSTGSAGVLELLDSEEMLLDVRLGLARLQADYFHALAELEWAIGTVPPDGEARP